ncbi:MAG: hypothetical protein GY811_13505 [Myxococcales bacterium]|nr:hypothetical protein [Myxococcales bacterium]
MTVLTSHIGYDDRQPTLVTVPQAGAMDKTLVFNGTKQGHAFLTELDFNQATLDGSSSDSATLVTNTYMIPLPLSVQHPKMAVGTDGNLHVVFLGTDSLNRDTSDSSGFSDQRVLRGVYHMKLSPTGTLMAGPTELYSKLPPNHGHTHPVVQVDSSGDVHTVFRAGACGWTGGPSGCDLYYAKLDGEGQALIPTQRLALMRNQAFEKAPSLAISPNGNVNLVYASVRPLPGNSNLGGYANGRILVLHVLSTVGNELTTLVDQKALMPLMIPSFADGNNDVSTYMIPAVACDAGGNLHIVSSEDNNAHLGTYMIFSPDGTKLAGPFTTTAGSGHDQQLPSVQIEGTRAFLSYATRNGPRATSFEFSGLSIDQSGAAQIPPPSADLTLTAATPDQGDAGQSVVLTLVGSGFRDGTTATVGGVAMSGLTRYDAAHLVGTLDTTGMAAGAHDVVVASPEETSATLVGGFYIGTRPSDEPDAGVDSEPDAGTDNKSDGGGCGCQQSGESTPLASLLLVGFLLVALRRRRTN